MTTQTTPKYHVVLSRPFDLEQFAKNAQQDKCPRHTMWTLAQKLGATVHQPGQHPISPADRFLSKLMGGSLPEHWAMARAMSKQVGKNDIIFSIGEDSGFPIATVCGAKVNRPKMAVFVHNADRPRSRVAMKLFNLANRVDVFMTNTQVKADFLQNYLGLASERVYLVTEQTDTQFFTPGLASADKKRPIVGSGGLEQRDYCTLAEATQDLDLDVKICAVSPNAKAIADTFPPVLPKNMSRGFYDWPDLRQLYRDSDIVVISLKPHNYQAGFTTLFEAMSCGRPVIMTRTPGLAEELAEAGIITGVNAQDPQGMRQAIVDLLNNPEKAKAQAQRGYELVQGKYNSEQYVDGIANQLMSLEPEQELILAY
ncbi:glycosyltransferase family 4 protein [Capilliphycus salinus ALCB114379]|uniref:glycosyltransferase family 4 protein n=1 Tax=Capilliphycus salinus TaxID=2768948 RepID=UPI0039A54B27